MPVTDEEVLEKWFLMRNIRTTTQRPYMVAMNEYVELTGKTPSELIEDAKKENLSDTELTDRRVTLYLLKYKKKLQEDGKAPKTLNLYFSAIKSFYRAFTIMLPDIKLDSGDIGLEENMGRPLTRNHLRKLIGAASSREKAMIYLMAMSGMAQQEARDLKIKKLLETASEAINIELDNVYDLFKHEGLVLKEILTLEFVREKVKYKQHTFLAPEVTRELIIYLKERCYGPNENIRIENNNEPIFVNINGISMSRDSVVTNFRRIGIKAGFKKDKGTYSYWRSHALRKYFISTIINKTGSKIIADYLSGHKISAQDRTYWQSNTEDLKKHYLKALPYLSIDEANIKDYETKEFRELNAKLKEQDTESQKLKEIMMYSLELQRAHERLLWAERGEYNDKASIPDIERKINRYRDVIEEKLAEISTMPANPTERKAVNKHLALRSEIEGKSDK